MGGEDILGLNIGFIAFDHRESFVGGVGGLSFMVALVTGHMAWRRVLRPAIDHESRAGRDIMALIAGYLSDRSTHVRHYGFEQRLLFA